MLNIIFMRKFICIVIGLLVSQYSLAQSVDEAVQKVRDRYYRINGAGVSLSRQDIEEATYYFEEGRIAIVKVPTSEGRYEFYYDYDDRSGYYPYFIYFESKDKSRRPDLRLYYQDKMQLAMYKENQDEIPLDMYSRPEMANELLLKSMNYLHAYRNNSISLRSAYEARMKGVKQQVASLNSHIVKIDTISDNSYEDEGGGYDGEIHYLNAAGEVVKKYVYGGGEHGGEHNITYFDRKHTVYQLEQKSLWAPMLLSVNASETFYEAGQAFIAKNYETYGASSVKYLEESNGDFLYDFEEVTPAIKILADPARLRTARFAGTYKAAYDLGPGGAADLLIYPETDHSVLFFIYLNRGAPSHNMGEMYGRIELDGQRGFLYRQPDYQDEPCGWEVVFGDNGTLEISSRDGQQGCGFGFGVQADHEYQRVSSDIPQSFEPMQRGVMHFNNAENWKY